MATDLENLRTARSNLLAALAECAGKPNYSFEGQTVTWGELFDRLGKIDKAIAAIQGPVEIHSQGIP